MSIIDSFDKDRMGIINPEVVSQKSTHKLRVLIINFSYKIMDALLENDLVELIDDESVSTVADRYPIYRFKGTDIGIVKTSIGAPMAAGMIEETGHIFSCEKFVLFGSGGGLDKTIPPSKLIVPTRAYRDEGMSYHYAPASDYIEIRNSGRVAEILTELGVDFVSGKTWTTDAFYRETKRNMERRKSEGCIIVEMEVSACQAVCDFRGYELYPFLYRADNLDSTNWDKSILSLISIDERLKHLFIALELAKRI
ncbi:MAG: nucleoside phosphorylase [Clostridia bacterium]|nr:nucleoside phosphorylase [Clostridia bacterium]